MLHLEIARNDDECIYINGPAVIRLCSAEKGVAVVGIDAQADTTILRANHLTVTPEAAALLVRRGVPVPHKPKPDWKRNGKDAE